MNGRSFATTLHLNRLLILALLCLLASQLGHSQEMDAAVEANTPSETTGAVMLPPAAKQREPVASEITIMGMFPDGDYRLFSATTRCYVWTLGVEYDRNSWGRFLGSQFDYVAEVLPIVVLSQPAVSDFWGNAYSPNQVLVPGVSISPFGMRFLWRQNKAIKPYISGKLGTIAFTKKAFSQSASYANFNVQAAFGIQVMLTKRVGLDVEPFEFFHVSNGYLAASNPGMDQLATKYGITYRLGKQVQ